jgi:putative thioredoxin
VDANTGLSAAFGIQGIPAVKAFRDGQVVGEFVGVQSEESVRRFVELALPSEVDVLVATAERSAAVGDPEGAEAGFRAVLAEEPAHERAVLGLTELLVDRGDHQEAAGLLDRVPASERARRLRATVELRTAEGADGPLSAAAAAAARGDHRAALESSLEVLRGNGDRDAARALMIRVFDLLGPDDPLTREFRPQLANALF